MKRRSVFNSCFDELNPEPRYAWVGWVASLFLHIAILIIFRIGFDRQGLPEGSNESFHDIGLFAKNADNTLSEKNEVTGLEDSQTPTIEADRPLLTESPVLETEPAVPLRLPESATIGAGPGPGSNLDNLSHRGASDGSLRSALQVPGGTEGNGVRFGRSDGTSFFQISAKGNHFFYVVDCSGSMDDGVGGVTPIAVARAELMASLERLDSTKQFQIVFYNSEVFPLQSGRQQLFFATDINRTLAWQFVNQQLPDGGTLHKPALTAALRYGPDVIYFLTDGEDPEMSSLDLQEIQKLNRKPSQIHVIQFGRGAKLGRINWLEQLASRNSGSYRYRNISDFKDK